MSNKRIALYSGSFDPFTKGHLDIVKRASKIFDKVYILLALNHSKSTRMFQSLRMLSAIQDTLNTERINENVSVMLWQDTIAAAARKFDADYIIRGIRNAADLDYEATVARGDQLLSGGKYLEHVYLLATPEYAQLSSTLVREMVRCHAPMETFNDLVPYAVCCNLRDYFGIKFSNGEGSETETKMIIGVTGRSGSGKSTMAKVFEKEYGAKIIDADAVYADLLVSNLEMRSKIATMFPNAVRSGLDNSIDKRKLANIVFNSSPSLEILNGITTPYIVDAIKEIIREATEPIIVIDAARLLDCDPLNNLCEKIIVVTAPQEILKARIQLRDGISEAEASARLESQNEWFTISDGGIPLYSNIDVNEEVARQNMKEFIRKLMNKTE